MVTSAKVALYGRVSTSDKNQDPETQLIPLREFAQAQGWQVYEEYVDHAPANDLAHRTQWRRLQDDAAKKKILHCPGVQIGPGLPLR